MIAVQAKDYDTALNELAQASNQNPRVHLLHRARLPGQGRRDQGGDAFRTAADCNQLNGVYGFVQSDARRQLARS